MTIQGVNSVSLKDTQFGKPTRGAQGQMIQPTIDPKTQYYVEYHCTLHSN